MRRVRLVAAIVTCLAMLVPAIATAQTNPDTSAYSLGAALTGASEVPGPGDADGFGYARISIDFAAGQLCYRVSVANVDDVTAAHIHVGTADVDGPIMIPLAAPVDGMSSGCVPITGADGVAMLNNPGGYYVNVHSSANPAGAVRGQLEPLEYLPGNIHHNGPYVTVVADGLNGPRGLDWDSDGNLYFTDNGAMVAPGSPGCVTLPNPETGEEQEVCANLNGQVWMVTDGAASVVASDLPNNMTDLTFSADGDLSVLVGLGGHPDKMRPVFDGYADERGYLMSVDLAGNSHGRIADISSWEVTANPAGEDVDTNPYGVLAVGDGFLVADAGANAIVHVAADGGMSTYAVLPPLMADAPPFLGLPEGTQIPAQSVPTAIVQGPDGAFYVSELTGFPYPIGGSRIWRLHDVNGDGDALDEGEMTIYAQGLTNVVDLAFDAHGHLYVLEIAKHSLLAGMDGALVRVESDGSLTEVLSAGLVAPQGMAIAPDGLTIYIANFSVMPGMGQILQIKTAE